jgi:hypothetical protein
MLAEAGANLTVEILRFLITNMFINSHLQQIPQPPKQTSLLTNEKVSSAEGMRADFSLASVTTREPG